MIYDSQQKRLMARRKKTTSGRTGAQRSQLISILKILVWPVFAFLLVLIFQNKVALKEMEVGIKGAKISFFLLAAAAQGGANNTPPQEEPDAKRIQEAADKAAGHSLEGAQVLWVDDRPENQRYERQALEVLGVNFTPARTTDAALAEFRSRQFQVVITDYSRNGDDKAGFTLLGELKKMAAPPPVIIYTAGVNPEKVAYAKQQGAFDETDQPLHLFDSVIRAIHMQQK